MSRRPRLSKFCRHKSHQSSHPHEVEIAPRQASRTGAKPTRADLMNAESALGRTLFGPIPEGHQREFFHHQRNIWIWHESWIDDRHLHSVTTRYEVRPSGVFKRSGHADYVKLEGDELKNFRHAAHAYLKIVKEKLYN